MFTQAPVCRLYMTFGTMLSSRWPVVLKASMAKA